jgi:hypothetical protein
MLTQSPVGQYTWTTKKSTKKPHQQLYQFSKTKTRSCRTTFNGLMKSESELPKTKFQQTCKRSREETFHRVPSN